MSSPFVRRGAAVTAGAAVFAGLVAPVAAHAAEPAGLGSIPASAVTVSDDPDGAGSLYTLTQDISTYTTITMPDDATLDGAGHKITAVEDAEHRNFPGPVLASAVGNDSAPAELDVENLDITTQGFEGGSNSDGLTGIYMYRAGGSLTDVSVDGISHGNGVQEGNAISIRNRISGDDINVPRAKVELSDIEVTNYQKTGLLLDGNLTFTVENARVGQGAGPQGQPNPTIAANSLQISRGASGSVTNSTIKLNSHEEATGVLLYNAKNVDFDRVRVDGNAPATAGIDVSNNSNTINTAFTMRAGHVTRTATPASGTGIAVHGPADAITATVTDTAINGWATETAGSITRTSTPEVKKVDVNGTFQATRPHPRRLRIDLQASELRANEVEGKMLRWRIKVDGRFAAAIRQHAGETDVWAQTFRPGTGKHTVQIVKNDVLQRTYKVFTR
jgi:hypothetical protein